MGVFRPIFIASLILLGLVLIQDVDGIFWRRKSTPVHSSTTIVSRPHHHHGGLRPVGGPRPHGVVPQPAAVAQQQHHHNIWQRPGHVHAPGAGGGGVINAVHQHVHSTRPRPPLVGAHHGTVRHSHFRQLVHG